MKLEYRGIDETRKMFFDANRLHGAAVQETAQKIAEDLARGLRKNAPTWRGTLKQAITAYSSMQGDTATGVAEADTNYAAAVDEGTGVQGPKGQRYFPDPTSPDLVAWAAAKGWSSAHDLAYIIWVKGTRPKKFFEKTVTTFLDKAVHDGGAFYMKRVFGGK